MQISDDLKRGAGGLKFARTADSRRPCCYFEIREFSPDWKDRSYPPVFLMKVVALGSSMNSDASLRAQLLSFFFSVFNTSEIS